MYTFVKKFEERVLVSHVDIDSHQVSQSRTV